ncbi:hypothetical protein N7462_005075 [Penicillium macrosclerotiorum]|uniref:uncharacterized protein n=1 Tax=Penicillium macrosclerotiorum TaxID=303699 RepID=UPI0025481AFE|nr:uncharacterized protein N7462_005075 [Penicillium macrosclerotiorum]KAJ5690683.1 hypothetical protein N7462_005075 [Penicillium macrosclerotiorum]
MNRHLLTPNYVRELRQILGRMAGYYQLLRREVALVFLTKAESEARISLSAALADLETSWEKASL